MYHKNPLSTNFGVEPFFLLAACSHDAGGYDDAAGAGSGTEIGGTGSGADQTVIPEGGYTIQTDGSWLIYTADALVAWGAAAASDLTLSATLAADIDMANRDWTPVGTANDASYTGTFDGGGYAISNLKIETSEFYAGLFAYLTGTVKNLGLKNAEITSSANSGMFVGGIAGRNEGEITGCYSTGSVEGFESAGGSAGQNGGTITACYWESDSVDTGIGSGSGSATKVDGTTTTWITAQNEMNKELDGTGYKYSGATTTEPPKLIKS